MDSMEYVITDCLYLTPIESLVPIGGHLSYPEGLVFIHGLHLIPIDGLACCKVSLSSLGSTETLTYIGSSSDPHGGSDPH